jgi:hypothetical protein
MLIHYISVVVCADRNNKSCQSLKTLRPEKSQNIGRCHHLARYGNCNSITEITEGKIYSNCQNLNV